MLVQTAFCRIIFMSMSGVVARSSAPSQPAIRMTAAASSPSTLAEPHPQLGPSLSATSRATSQADSRIAGRKLIRPGVRISDSGTNRTAAIAAATVRISGSQNSQW